MNITFNLLYVQMLFIVCFIHIESGKVYAVEFQEHENKLIKELHSMYKDAFENEKTYITRRLFTRDGNSHYTLHVEKLKEVNGVKTHNLRVEGRTKPEAPIMYINNPVEAGMPNPYFSIDEFKTIMLKRVENQKKEFDVKRQIILNATKQYKATHSDNFTNEIFDVKKHTELAIKNLTEKPVITTLNKGNNKINRKIKQKVNKRITPYLKPVKFVKTSSSHLITTNTFPQTIANNEITTETVVNEDNITQSTSYEEITIKSLGDKNVTAQSAANEDTTDPATVVEITTKSTVEHNMTSESTTDDTTETAAEYNNTQEPAATNLNNTDSTTERQITTEQTTAKEIITEPATTSTTVRTTKTRQLRPYVFMGNPDKTNSNY